MNAYRQRILKQISLLLSDVETLESVLDFGSGDGWFAAEIAKLLTDTKISTIDVKRRGGMVMVEPELYSQGESLPYADNSFDLVYAIDVLHHCDSPDKYLYELARISRKYILIKDHSYFSQVDRIALAVLDEMGNRRFGIPSPQNYQHGWSWSKCLQSFGWRVRTQIYPCPCHVGLLGTMTNKLQYMALYERIDDPSGFRKVQSL